MQDTLQGVVGLAEQAVRPADMTGITMLVDDKPSTAFFSDEAAPEIDQSQYAVGSGPCLDTFKEAKMTRIDSTLTEERWPEFAETAVRHGIHSTMSLPLVVPQCPLGALNFYSRQDRAFDEEQEHRGWAFANQASIVLANAQAYWGVCELNENLKQAMQSRAMIEQAKGIVMARSHVDAERAFEILREASQRANRKLRDMATELVEQAASGGHT